MSRVSSPIDMDALTELTMCDEGVDYFEFAAAVAELVETGHLTLEDGRYTVTEKGRRNGSICESSLPYSVRIKCDKNVARLNGRLRQDAQVQTVAEAQPDGSYTARMSLDDESGNLLTLELTTASSQQADRLCAQFKAHPDQVYNGVLDVLLTNFDEEREDV